MDKTKDYYRFLQVDPGASLAVIDAAYRIVSQRVHGVDLKDLADAHLILSNPKTRAEYDALRNQTDGPLVGGKYRIDSLIDQGVLGETYKATNLNVGETVCIKHCSTISEEAAAMLLNQAKALWNLRHHSLPAVKDLLRLDDGTVALVMSYIPRPTWSEMIEAGGAMHPEHVTWLAERLLNALRFLHLRGSTIHGDVNPRKIMIKPEMVMATLVGFDFCLYKPGADDRSRGYTDIFSPIEAVQGMPLLPGTDLFGLGMTMVYALNGDLEETRQGTVPDSTPDLLCNFIKRLIVPDVLERPSWESEDLCETIHEIKVKCFGKKSRIKPIPWKKED